LWKGRGEEWARPGLFSSLAGGEQETKKGDVPVSRVVFAQGLTVSVCRIKVPLVKTTTIGELKKNTATVLAWVAAGESVEVLRRGVPVALLSPPTRTTRVQRPDFMARLKKIYGTRMLDTTGTDLVSEARGDS
jgi:antitoxin (DNA-binding transcriptional repressor) of toxin-antitoxin stability system